VIRAKDATIQELRDQLAASQAETDQVRSTSVPRSDAEKLQLEMDKLRGEITKLEVQLDTNEEELAALQTTVAAVNTENEKLLDLAKESLHREQLLDNKAATTLQLSGRSAAEARKEMDSLKKESARLQKLLHKHSVRNAGATKKSESERAASL
jgi:chromosome segregation ATPase